MTDPDERIHNWTDTEIAVELQRLTGDVERDIEREAMRRLIEKLNTLVRTMEAKSPS